MRQLTRLNEDFDYIKFLNSKIQKDIPNINKLNKEGCFMVNQNDCQLMRGAPVDIGTTTSGNAVFEGFEVSPKRNTVLNPKIFNKNKEGRYILKDSAKQFINKLVNFYTEAFEEACAPVKFPIKDVLIVGSNASYNYTEHSDLDIHIILDRPKSSSLKELYLLYNWLFKKTYKGITFNGIEAELYTELEETDTNSNGIYSLNTGWVKVPTPLPEKELTEGDKIKFEETFKKLEKEYFNLIGENK